MASASPSPVFAATEPESVRSTGKRIVALITGSRGDCQPYIALLVGLHRTGFVVHVITNRNYVSFVSSFGLSVAGVYLDAENLVRNSPELMACMADGDMITFMKLFGRMFSEIYPESIQPEKDAIEAFNPDLIVASPLSYATAHSFSCVRNIPIILLDLMGAVPSGYCSSLANEPANLPKWMHRLVWRLVVHSKFISQAAQTRIQSERLPEMLPYAIRSFEQLWLLEEFRPEPVLCGNSPQLIKPQPDWTQRRYSVTGHWTVPACEQEQRMHQGDKYFGGDADAELAAFIKAGAAPTYFGWGSMISVSSEHMACLAVRAAKLASMRAVILAGWAELSMEHLRGQPDSKELLDYAAANVLFVKTAAHGWLFPRCAAIVHHGGSGTVAASLRSGRPTIVTPCGFDQPWNGAMVEKSGAGVRLPGLKGLSAGALAAALRRVTEDMAILARAQEFGRKLQLEDGVARAVQEIDAFMSDEVATGVWAERRVRFLAKFKELERPSWFMRFGLMCSQLCTNSLQPLVTL